MSKFLADRAKLIAYVAGVLLGLVALGLLHGQVLVVVQVLLVLLTGGAIHQAPGPKPKP